MRRLSCALAAFLLIAPAGLRLALADSDSDAEALRCAIACGHAVKAGEVCCPMSSRRGIAMSSCPAGDPPAAAPLASAQLAILASIPPLSPPESGFAPSSLSSPTPRDALAAPPDHVPIRLS